MLFAKYCRFYFMTFICFWMHSMDLLQAQHCSSPTNLSVLPYNASSPQIAIDPFGNAIAVWYQFDGCHLTIQASTKLLGGSWQLEPDTLSLSDQDAFNPQIVIDSFGNATVVWEKYNGSHVIIQASTKLYGGDWQLKPDNLSLSNQNASNPQIAVDSLGNVVAIWQRWDGHNNIIQSSTKLFGSNWQIVPDNLSLPGQDAVNAQIAISEYDNTIVVWQRFDGSHHIIQAVSRFLQEDWQKVPENISLPGHHAFAPQIAVDSWGNATVVWNQFDNDYGMIKASTKLFGGNWQLIPDTLSLPGRNAFFPQIAIDLFGHVTVAWECYDEKKLRCIQTSTKPFQRNWQAIPDTLSLPGDHNTNVQIAVDCFGKVMVIWNTSKGFTCIHSSVKPFGGSWQIEPDIISSLGRSAFFPQISFDPFGNVIIVWVLQDSFSFIQATDKYFIR